MRYQDILKELETRAKTERNVALRFEYSEDIEGENRGWVIDKITAYVGDEEVGYLKIENIPRKNFEKFYPAGIVNWMTQVSGATGLMPYEKRANRVEALTDDELKRFIGTVYHYGGAYDARLAPIFRRFWNHPQTINYNRQALLQLVRLAIKAMYKYRGKKYKEFIDFHVDKPFVAFIKVKEPWLRKGIARALYYAGARWMKERGLRLYASGLQQPEAKAAWDQFQARGEVATDGDRRYLRV